MNTSRVVEPGSGYAGITVVPMGKRSKRILSVVVAAAVSAWMTGCGDEEADAGGRPIEVKAVFGEVGLNPGQFTYPRAITNDGIRLWVIDKSARVQRIDPVTGQSTALWTMPDWAMGKPCGVSIGPGGRIWIPDTHYFRVMEYQPPLDLAHQPELVQSFGSLGDGPGQFNYCTDVGIKLTDNGQAIDRLYVGEYGGNDRISVFGGRHEFLFAFGSYGSSSEPGTIEFSRPQSIEVDHARKQLVVTDACNHRVGVFDLDGHLVRWIGSPGSGPGDLAYPYGLALLGDGTALVTEFGNHRVHHLDYQNGDSLGTFGRPGRGRGELTNPWGVTVLGDTAFVLDSGNDRIQAFQVPVRQRTLSRGSQ
jgi:DNA-binding beta-propeller fold protein YncE